MFGLTVLSLAAALSVLSWHTIAYIKKPELFSFFALPIRIWEFGFGILVSRYWQFVGRQSARPWIVNILQVVAFAGLLLGLALGSDTRLVPGYQAILPCFSAAVLLATGERGFIGRLLVSRFLRFFGDRSYSIYLWQGPIIWLAAILFATQVALAVAALLSIVVAVMTSDTIESMFRKRRRVISANRKTSLAFFASYAGAILILVAADRLALMALSHFAAPLPLRATLLDRACERQRGVLGLAPCVYGEPDRPKVLLIGDSHAGAISQALVDAATNAGWQAHVATASACAVPEYPETIAYRASCFGFAENVFNYARQQKVDLVVLQQYSSFYVEDLRIGLQRWHAGLSHFLRSLADAGISALVIGDNLRLPLAVGRPVWAHEWWVDLNDEIQARAAIEAAEGTVVASIYGMQYMRARSHLCKGTHCPVFHRGEWQYTDGDHLSFRGARPLTGPIEVVLKDMRIVKDQVD